MKTLLLFAFIAGIYEIWFHKTPQQVRQRHYKELKDIGKNTAKSMGTTIKKELNLLKEAK